MAVVAVVAVVVQQLPLELELGWSPMRPSHRHLPLS
tara:strand:- start:95 stop:202 length:108 start_codon:yes stop_codon:yes gene_type:complete